MQEAVECSWRAQEKDVVAFRSLRRQDKFGKPNEIILMETIYQINLLLFAFLEGTN